MQQTKKMMPFYGSNAHRLTHFVTLKLTVWIPPNFSCDTDGPKTSLITATPLINYSSCKHQLQGLALFESYITTLF